MTESSCIYLHVDGETLVNNLISSEFLPFVRCTRQVWREVCRRNAKCFCSSSSSCVWMSAGKSQSLLSVSLQPCLICSSSVACLCLGYSFRLIPTQSPWPSHCLEREISSGVVLDSPSPSSRVPSCAGFKNVLYWFSRSVIHSWSGYWLPVCVWVDQLFCAEVLLNCRNTDKLQHVEL